MKSEQLASLGENLRRDFQALLTGYTINWLDEEQLSQADIQPVHVLQADLAQLAYVVYEFAGIEAWLTSGFVPADLAPLSTPSDKMTGEEVPTGPVRFIQEKQLAQNQLPHRDSGSLPADAYSPHRPFQMTRTQPPVKGLEAFVRWLESEPATPAEEAETAGPAAMTTHAPSRDQEKAARSKKLGAQNFEASRLANSSDDRPVFVPGTDDRPAAMISAGPAAVPPSPLDPDVISATWQTLLRLVNPPAREETQYPELDAVTAADGVEALAGLPPKGLTPSAPDATIGSVTARDGVEALAGLPPKGSTPSAPDATIGSVTENLQESPRVQPGVVPNRAPANGRRIDALTQARSMASAHSRSDAISEPSGKPGDSASPDMPSNQGTEAGWPTREATARSYLSPTESLAGPVDLAEILEALARSLEQEYKRFYGS